jgi:hypothetical protein
VAISILLFLKRLRGFPKGSLAMKQGRLALLEAKASLRLPSFLKGEF